MDLFESRARRDRRGEPLAERMRPRDFSEFVGQRHLLGEGRMLARLVERGELPSLILWGPPGSGKTTLARIVAARAKADFVGMSAVSVGLKEVREVVAEARERLSTCGRRTVLFLDEIHRFHKGQQDALLPHVEAGTVVLVGATTENPSFEINAALLSRCKVVRLERLDDADVVTLLVRALGDRERGLPEPPEIAPGALEAIARHADGDARRALVTLEVAASLGRRVGPTGPQTSDPTGPQTSDPTGPQTSDPTGPPVVGPTGPPVVGPTGPPLIDEAVVAEALQKKTLLHDRAGDAHYDVVSAFIKSLRGSDPDAAVYWMARMIEAGEDPLFVCRRMVIFAGEDVGLADPRALEVAVAATEAARFVGLPECVLPMTMAALYLARAAKSNTALCAWAAAREAVETQGALPVPMHLRNAPTGLMKAMGMGAGYQYPHDFAGHCAPGVDYLPEALRGKRLYEPSGQGEEK